MVRRRATLGALVLALAIAAGLLAVVAVPVASAATSIHVLGSFNDWDEGLWNTDPGMTHIGNLWRDTIDVHPRHAEQGYQQFKLVTDRAWDQPADYCLCPDRLDEYDLLSGPVCPIAYGLNLQMYADVPGRYEISLAESVQTYSARLLEPFTASIAGLVNGEQLGNPVRAEVQAFPAGGTLLVARAFSDPGTGAFTLEHLDGGTYDLRINAFGYLEKIVNGVTVPPGHTIDVGTIILASGCVSNFSAIQVVGDFNGWDVNTPSMTNNGCTWQTILTVPAGCYYMKFRTNNVWGDDYGTCTAQDPNCQVPLSGNICLVNGELALGKIEFPITDSYVFRLDEFSGTYEITSLTTPVRPSTWGQIKVRYR